MRIRVALAALLVAGCITLCHAQPAPADGERPNIVVFLVDDMGWQDTSVPFWTQTTPLNRKFHTPNMQRLAAEGMKFTQAYACPVCSPSRVSLLTGLNAARHRVTNWTLKKNQATDARHPRLDFPLWNVNGISPVAGIERSVHAKCLPQFLREAGYRTIHVGKAHFGALDTPGAEPENLGFDVNIAGHAAGGPGSYLGEQNYSAQWRKGGSVWDVPGLEAYHGTRTFLTEALTREANKAVDQALAVHKPFFLYMAHYAVHVPFAPDDRFFDKYLKAGLDRTEAMYAALVEGMDKSLGDIMDHLARKGVADQTAILFMSDNGGLSAHARGGTPHTHNQPLSSGKGSAHEGGIREPMIVKWPGTVKPGTVCNAPVIIEDFFPTILQIAGCKNVHQIGGKLDGVSFLPLLTGQPAATGERTFVWHYPNNWGPSGPGIGAFSSMRKGDWKYIFYHDPGRPVREELFNIRQDIGETKNLASANPAQTRALASDLKRHLEDVGAQMPADKKTGEKISIP